MWKHVPFPCSFLRFATFRLVAALCNKLANFSILFGVSFCTGLKISSSSLWIRIFHCCCPYFLSMCSLAACYTYPKCPSTIDFRESPQKYWRNCKSLYSGLAGAWSIQAVNADFQFSYCRCLSPLKISIETLLIFFQISLPIVSLSFYNSILLRSSCSSIPWIFPSSSMFSIFSGLLVSLPTFLMVRFRINCCTFSVSISLFNFLKAHLVFLFKWCFWRF